MNLTFWLTYLTISFGVDFLLDKYETQVPLSSIRFFREFWANDRNFFPGVLGPIAVELALYYVVEKVSRKLR